MSESISIEILKERNEIILENVQKAALSSGRKVEDIKVIAVSKTHPLDYIYKAIDAGIKVFGENYAQEFRDKLETFDTTKFQHPEWHFIGHLQSNKVKYLAKNVTAIHSVDKTKLAKEINKRAKENERNISVMLQVNTSGEDSKFGCDPEKIVELCSEVIKFENIKVEGLMTIGTFTDDEIQQRKEFSLLRDLKDKINKELDLSLKHLSMGMTNDYPVAIDEGATMVRIGTAYFGQRNYNK